MIGKDIGVDLCFLPFLGKLNVTFDDNGNLLSASGQPELLNNSVPEDEDILQLLEKYRPATEELNNEIVATLKVTLDGESCRTVECNYGNLIADANVLYVASVSATTWTNAPIGLMNGGSIRTSISIGPQRSITRGDVIETLPFGNLIVSLQLSGEDLVKTLELGIRGNGETSYGEFLQVSGLKIVYDKSKPPMSRVVSIKTRCGDCDIPKYENIDLDKNYTIITTDYLADGFDGHYILKTKTFSKKFLDLGDVDVLIWYLKTHNPVYAEIQDRISYTESTKLTSDSSYSYPVTLTNLILSTISLYFIY